MSETFTKRSISAAAARRVVEVAAARAASLGIHVAIAVCDESGILKEFSRMDGAPLLSVEIAKDKAYTAAAFGIATHDWFSFIKDDPPLLHGITKVPRLIVFGGGNPLKVNGQVVGAIGISGGHYTQDMEIATAGSEALKEDVRV